MLQATSSLQTASNSSGIGLHTLGPYRHEHWSLAEKMWELHLSCACAPCCCTDLELQSWRLRMWQGLVPDEAVAEYVVAVMVDVAK